MALSRALITDYSTELARQATITLGVGAADTGYGVERLTDDEPDFVFRSPDDQVAIVFDFGAATPLRYIFQIHGTPEADDDVRLQANATNVWTSPSIDEPFVQAGWLGAGESRWPLNPWLDTSDIEGWNAGGYRYVRLAYGLTTPLSQALQLGQILMFGDARVIDLGRGARPRVRKPGISHVTAAGVRAVYPYRVSQWGMDFELGGLEAADRASLEAQLYDVDGMTSPFGFVPDMSVNRCYFGRWAQDVRDTDLVTAAQASERVVFEELSRGLRPGV